MNALRFALAIGVSLNFATTLFIETAIAADEPASRQIELKKGDRIVFFGDSLTALAIKDFLLTYDGNHWTEEVHKFVGQQMLRKFK